MNSYPPYNKNDNGGKCNMKWVSTFKYITIPYDEVAAFGENLTQRVLFDHNVKGEKVRVRFSNRYGQKPMQIEKATIGKYKDGKVIACKTLTCGGHEKITLAPDERILSDEVDYETEPGEKLVINLYFKERQNITGTCCFWSETGTVVEKFTGDVTNGGETDRVFFTPLQDYVGDTTGDNQMHMFTGFDAVQVYTQDEVKVIAAFGDSITHMSYFTNPLLKRLLEEANGKAVLINSGIGGNRLLDDATVVDGKSLVFFGEAGLKRFEEDVFGLDDVDAVLVLIGINDIMHPIQLQGKAETVTAEDLIAGFRQITATAHDNGAEVYFGTITPSGNPEYPDWWIQMFEETRNGANSYIRSGEGIEGYFDYDRELRDEAKPDYIREGCHLGDGLHPNNQGGVMMADLIDLRAILG